MFQTSQEGLDISFTSSCLSISWDHAYKEIEYLSLESINSICVGSNYSNKNIQHILSIHKKKAKNI